MMGMMKVRDLRAALADLDGDLQVVLDPGSHDAGEVAWQTEVAFVTRSGERVEDGDEEEGIRVLIIS